MSKGFKRGPDTNRYDNRCGNKKPYEQEELTTCNKQDIAKEEIENLKQEVASQALTIAALNDQVKRLQELDQRHNEEAFILNSSPRFKNHRQRKEAVLELVPFLKKGLQKAAATLQTLPPTTEEIGSYDNKLFLEKLQLPVPHDDDDEENSAFLLVDLLIKVCTSQQQQGDISEKDALIVATMMHYGVANSNLNYIAVPFYNVFSSYHGSLAIFFLFRDTNLDFSRGLVNRIRSGNDLIDSNSYLL